MRMHLVSRHQSLRRKGVIASTARPHSFVRALDLFAVLVSCAGIAVTLDQARIIWIDHNASGVSLITWSFYAFSSFVWLSYGYMHKDRIIFLTNLCWVFVNITIAAGIIMYSA